MRVIICGYLGSKITGIGRYTIEILKELAQITPDVEYLLYTNYDNEQLLSQKFPGNVKVRTYRITKNKAIHNLLFNGFVFPLLSLWTRSDMVLAPNFIPILFKFKPTLSVIYDMIEFKFKDKFSKLRTRYRYFIVPRMAKLSEHVITISENSKQDIVAICQVPPSKVSVAYCAVSDHFHSELPSPCPHKYMLFVGTVDYPGKNVFNSIKAFEIYKKNSGSDLKFVICGMPGKDFHVIEKLMRESPFRDDIIYNGYVTEEQLHAYYRHAALFIFASYYEGFGLPILEAMKMGTPVITSDRSSLPEVAGDAAEICDPDDPEALAASIRRIVEDESHAQEMIRKGYANLKRFSWAASAKIFYDIISCYR